MQSVGQPWSVAGLMSYLLHASPHGPADPAVRQLPAAVVSTQPPLLSRHLLYQPDCGQDRRFCNISIIATTKSAPSYIDASV